jgi:hypothetical protein
MTTTSKAASNGNGSSAPAPVTRPGDGLAKLRRQETKALISLACDALSQAHHVMHEMHSLIYGKDEEFRPEHLSQMAREAVACWATTDHYLLMLASVLGDFDPYSGSELSELLQGPHREPPF